MFHHLYIPDKNKIENPYKIEILLNNQKFEMKALVVNQMQQKKLNWMYYIPKQLVKFYQISVSNSYPYQL